MRKSGQLYFHFGKEENLKIGDLYEFKDIKVGSVVEFEAGDGQPAYMLKIKENGGCLVELLNEEYPNMLASYSINGVDVNSIPDDAIVKLIVKSVRV